MTYADATIVPGPRLNLVLGPNGTGKSSLVCALCVGLGGSTKALGRADNLRDYVRRGMSHAWTEITLSGGPGQRDHVIRRDIRLERTDKGDTYVSSWKLNNASKREKDVVELVQGMNIQFDNLCQFLPQDKVVEFARMDAFELLRKTEEALGDATLHRQHMELIAKRHQAKHDEMSRGVTERELQRAVAENAKLERDYERFTRRQELLKEADTLRAKLVWAECSARKEVARAAKAELEVARRQVEEKKKEQEKDEEPLRMARKVAKAAAERVGASAMEGKRLDKQSQALQSEIDKTESDIVDKGEELQGLQAMSQQRAAKLQDLGRTIDGLRGAIASLPAGPPPELAQEAAEIDRAQIQLLDQQVELQEAEGQLQHRSGDLHRRVGHIEGRLHTLDNAKQQRLQALEQRFRGVGDMYSWLQANKHLFQGPVYGPVAAEISLRDASYAAHVEHQLGQRLGWFIASTPEDERALTAEMKRRGLHNTVFSYTGAHDAQLEYRCGRASAYSAFGITHTLDEVIEAPPLVKLVLAAVCAITSTFIGTQQTSGVVEEMFARTPVRSVICPDAAYSLKTSAYNAAARTTQMNPLRRPHLLAAGGAEADGEERQGLIASRAALLQEASVIEGELAQVRSQLSAIGGQKITLEERKRELDRRRHESTRRRQDLTAKLTAKSRELRLAQQTPEPMDKEPQIRAELAQLCLRLVRKLKEVSSSVQAQWAHLRQTMVLELRAKEADMQDKALKAGIQSRAAEIQRLLAAQQAAEAKSKTALSHFRESKQKAEAEAPMDEERAAAFRKLPEDREALTGLLEDKEAEAERIVCNNPHVVEEYRTRARLIGEQTTKLQAMDAGLGALNGQIQEIRAQWLPELERLVGTINETFSANFRDIGCAGEVALVQHEDYDKFAVQIRVKFRNDEELQPLTANRQSGGERSVCTILYLIALQGVTVTPFRVVDEINQGMDPVNERKVFGQLVAASCRDGTPQCFLLTPKLLPGLPFQPSITVLNIFNGSQIGADVAKNYSRDMLYGRRALPVAG